jgi:hypothetical protein
MKNVIRYLAYLFLPGFIILIWSCAEDHDRYGLTFPSTDKFLILPSIPVSGSQVSMVTCDCKYNILASVTQSGNEITVKKRFNGQLKWPCILQNDTIPLGRLNEGSYRVTLLIIDTNPFVNDSISVKETITLNVGK